MTYRMWGPEIFNDDGALDYLRSILQQLVQTIEDCFTQVDGEALLDDCVWSKLMPSVELLTTLCTKYEMFPHLEEQAVKEWKEKYLRIYDEHFDYFKVTRYPKAERRKAIEETFNRLIEFAEYWHSL
jgi:hypothetical protein